VNEVFTSNLRSAAMKSHKVKTFDLEVLEDAILGNTGFCLACGDEEYGCEPDARKYECSSCGAHMVFGAEEIILMGLVK